MTNMELWRRDFDERYPIYRQIVEQFRRSIAKGELEAGERIPSIRDMAVTLQVNTNTIQRAYQELEKENIIYSQRGMGYFVKEEEEMVQVMREQMVQELIQNFIEQMTGLGFSKEEIQQKLGKELEQEEDSHATDNKGFEIANR